MTESALRSSPLSHDTAESSLDSSYSRTSELSSCVGRERSLERDRYEESNRITDEEITNHSEAVKVCLTQCYVLEKLLCCYTQMRKLHLIKSARVCLGYCYVLANLLLFLLLSSLLVLLLLIEVVVLAAVESRMKTLQLSLRLVGFV